MSTDQLRIFVFSRCIEALLGLEQTTNQVSNSPALGHGLARPRPPFRGSASEAEVGAALLAAPARGLAEMECCAKISRSQYNEQKSNLTQDQDKSR
jgi:hypothetical protein